MAAVVASKPRSRLSLTPSQFAATLDGEEKKELENHPENKNESVSPTRVARKSLTGANRRKSLKFGAHIGSPETKEERQRVNQVLDVFQNVVKLCAENKVNTKNSWALNLIENIDTVLGAAKGSFHRAATTLSAAVEIYGQRVDGTHEDTFKMLETVLNSEKRGDADGEDAREKRKKGTGETQAANTLEMNLANINQGKVDKEFDLDPLFRKMLKAFDEGGARGMLLNHLSVHNGCSVVFDTNDVIPFASSGNNLNQEPEEEEEEEEKNSQTTKQEEPPSIFNPSILHSLKPEDRKICLSLEILRDEALKDENKLLDGKKNTTGTSEATPSQQDTLSSIHPHPSDFAEEPEFYEVDNDYGYDYDDENEDSAPLTSSAFASHVKPVATGSTLPAENSMAVNLENFFLQSGGSFSSTSYFDPSQFASKSWAGPSHWKLAAPKLTTNNNSAEGKATKAPKVIKRIDFFSVPKSEFEFSKAATVTTISNKKSFLLPEDVHYNVQDLLKLFFRPSCNILFEAKTTTLVGMELPIYSGEEPSFDDAESFYDCDEDEENGANGAESVAGLNLVAPAHHVERIRVAFATRAKKVDVKKLKSDLWSTISQKLHIDEEEMVKQQQQQEGDSTSKAIGNEEPVVTLNFTETIEEMAPNNNQNVTVPFYFICMLHLCNELGLELSSSEELDDIKIRSH